MSVPSDDALEITTDAVEITHSHHTRDSIDAREGVAAAVSSDEMESKYADGSPHETHDDLHDLPSTHSSTSPRRGKMKEPKTTLSGGSIFKKKKLQQTPQNRQDLMEMNSPFSRRQLSELENIGDSEGPITPLPHDQVDISGAVFNLLNYTIGAGVLALPYAFAQAGLGLGMFLVAIVYSANLLTDWFLLGATRASLGFSYEQLAEAAFGHRFAIAVKCFIIFDSFGTLSAYMLVIGDTLHKFFAHYYSDNLTTIDPRFLMFIVLIVFLIPFCFIQNINSFAISSVISIIPLIYLIIYQFIYYSKHGTKAGESVRGVEQGIGFFNALPVVIFAFSSQQVFYPIWNEIRERGGGENHMARVIHYAGISSVITYLLSGLGGYLIFPQSASAMILDSYPISIELNVLLIITAVSIVLSYPVVVFPCRMNIDRLIFPTKELSYFRFVVINIAVVIAAFGIAVAIPSFAAILGFFGAFTSTSIAYLMPAAFYLRLNREPFHKNRMKWIAALLFIAAAAGGLTSFVIIARDFRPTYEGKESNA